MGLTKTVHPPAGATALIAVVDDRAVSIGWRLIPLVLLGCAIMLVVALILNNILGRFPLYWWTPNSLTPLPPKQISGSSSGEEEKDRTLDSKVVIFRDQVDIPAHIQLSPEESLLLEQISSRL
jgi:CBS-domain-containing membrane protein